MKTMMMTFILLFSFTAGARIVQVSDSTLEDDLGFKLDQDEKEVREVAGEQPEADSQTEESESERDVASENESLDVNIRYWKY